MIVFLCLMFFEVSSLYLGVGCCTFCVVYWIEQVAFSQAFWLQDRVVSDAHGGLERAFILFEVPRFKERRRQCSRGVRFAASAADDDCDYFSYCCMYTRAYF
jgi:hypothetical protein